jgi:hypothetical protein
VQTCDDALAALQHGGRADAQERALAALLPFIIGQQIGEAGADTFTAVMAALAARVEHAGVQLQGVLCLRYLYLTNDYDMDEMAALEATVIAMRAHPTDANILEAACAALASAFGEGSVTVIKSSHLAAVLAAMQGHVAHAGVQQNGCTALQVFFKVYDDAEDSDDASEASDPWDTAGAVMVVVNAMREHGEHAGLLERGCAALCSIVDADDSEEHAIDAGVAAAVVAAMRACSVRAHLQQNAMRILAVIASSADEVGTVVVTN